MPNYKRRFTKDEFKQELFTHLTDMPRGFLKAKDKDKENLDHIVHEKAVHYARALEALDAAAARISKLAESHPDAQAKTEADTAIKEINSAIDAYGEASMSGNSSWDIPFHRES